MPLVSPRHLVLNLLLGAGGQALGAREAVAAGALFGFQDNSVRVALARLSAAGLIVSTARGAYALGPGALALAADVGQWRVLEQRVVDWSGDWIAVYAGGLGRSDRPALRVRERALGLLGLAEFERGLYLRPDNLAGGVAGVRERLRRLAPDQALTAFVARDFEPDRDRAARACWDGAALTLRYRDAARRLDAWRASASRLDLQTAARESFLLGDTSIRELVFDPLLPQPLVDVAARRAFLEAVRHFDDAGQAIWQRFLADARERTPASRARPAPSPSMEICT